MSLKHSLAQALDLDPDAMQPIGGGDFADAYCVSTEQGQFFLKTHPNPPANFFATEATGLTWLREAGFANTPKVIAVADEPPAFLMLQWVEPGGRARDDVQFGRALATLHQRSFDCFGRPDHATTGSLALPNPPTKTWCEFFADCRLRPLVRIAAERGALSKHTRTRIEAVADRLDQWIDPATPPSLVHGDLWAGNRIVDRDGHSWLIDPAAHGNHPYFDLAMMKLFGGFGPDIFAAYFEKIGYDPAFESLVPLMQLAPLTVHAIKFGGHYASATEQALSALGH
ncbi:MAG: fructosamine kinase family protein [Gammaproteobacteria bacterium]|nr:fructosamine kinase family protein [Gammaproteobacteria bacterium]